MKVSLKRQYFRRPNLRCHPVYGMALIESISDVFFVKAIVALARREVFIRSVECRE